MNDEYLIYGETLKGIADSIRSVSSVSTTWTPDEMAAYILENLVKPTTRQAAKTYTPSTANQTIPAGTFLTGAATIQGDADWVPGNIKKGVNMWGKTGTLSGAWGEPSNFAGISKVASGSFTLTSTSAKTNYTVTHGLGTIPKIACFMLDTGSSYEIGAVDNTQTNIGVIIATRIQLSSNIYSVLSFATHRTNSSTYYYDLYTTHPGFYTNSLSQTLISVDSTTMTLRVKTSSSGVGRVGLVYPAPYRWIALA